jgi:diguanylate cyclase (GGDEF)-like protein
MYPTQAASAAPDEDALVFADEPLESPAQTQALPALRPWTVLVVDDDADVHQATELALRGLNIEDRPLQLIHAYSAAQARELVATHDDIAVMLLDVVMEVEDAGLRLVDHVRHELKRSAVRIILRTGQPGYAPELDTVRNYDINDYKTKSELTRVRLFTSLTAAVRAYRQMRSHEDMRRGLEMVVKSSTELNKVRGIQLFAQGVVGQLCALLRVEHEGLICAQTEPGTGSGSARVIAAAGRFEHLQQRRLPELGLPQVQEALQRCLNERRSQFGTGLALYFPTDNGRGLAAYVDVDHALDEMDRHLLEVFCAATGVGFENVLLYGRLVDQAYVDPLLRIPNLNRLIELLADPQLDRLHSTLALVDIDDFSAINDSLGHEFGDAVLRAVAERLGVHLPGSSLARLGADVFGVLGPTSEVDAERLRRVFAEVFSVQGQRVRVSASIGLLDLSGACQRGRAGPELLKDAHVALKQAKQHQRGTAIRFSEAMGLEARERMQLLAGLRQAFDAEHLFLVYQPKMRLQDGGVSGVEALLRWRQADGQFVPPDRFIPLAEQAGLMVALGTFVLRAACKQLALLRAAGHQDLCMAINVSQAQLREPGFVGVLRQAIRDADVPPEKVELEITESMAAVDLELIDRLLGEIVALGVRIAIDDFGTGFSSLSVLRRLQAQRLKIDRSFVGEMEKDDSIARTVVGLGHSLGMRITAEGVETEQQADALKALGCEEAQGWLFAKPLEAEALLGWLAARR